MNRTGDAVAIVIGHLALTTFSLFASGLGKICLFLAAQAKNLEAQIPPIKQEKPLLTAGSPPEPETLPEPVGQDANMAMVTIQKPAPTGIPKPKPRKKLRSAKVPTPTPKNQKPDPKDEEDSGTPDSLSQLLNDLPTITIYEARRRANKLGLKSQRVSRNDIADQIRHLSRLSHEIETSQNNGKRVLVGSESTD